MRRLDLNIAYDLMVFMTDAVDHLTGKAGLTLAITASKAGGAFASITTTVTDRGNGWYKLALTTAHLNTIGDFALHVTATGADTADLVMVVADRVLADARWMAGVALTIGDGFMGANFNNFFHNLGLPAGATVGQVATISSASSPIAAIDVKPSRTWQVGPDSATASNIVTVKRLFAGTLKAIIDLNELGDIASVSSVAITGAATPAATSLRKSGDGRAALFDVPSLTTVGSYTVVITVLSVDGQTFPIECRLIVR